MPASLIPSFVLGAVTIAGRAALDLSLEYIPVEGSSNQRMADGSLRKITIWQGKLRVEIRGSGRLPVGLQPGVLDYTATMTLKCFAPRAIPSASNVITVPAARRTDLSTNVIGVALLDPYEAVETPVSLSTNTATLTAVSGAVGYQALYFPQLTVYAQPPTETYDRRLAQNRWNITCLEA